MAPLSLNPKDLANQFFKGDLLSNLQKTGRMPPVTVQVEPLDDRGGFGTSIPLNTDSFTLDGILSYQFSSSVLIPVESFSVTCIAPDDPDSILETVSEGDIINLLANGIPIMTGIVDTVEIETDNSGGEKVTFHGRNLLGQLEDQDAISALNDPLWANATTVKQAVAKLIDTTRIPDFSDANLPTDIGSLSNLQFPTEPGESKLQAVQRFCEPINCLVWQSPDGDILVGKPNMSQGATGNIFCLKTDRLSNCISIKSSHSSSQIPNILLPIFAGQENTQAKVAKEQALDNTAEGPSKLRRNGHLVPKTIVVSIPTADNPQGTTSANIFKVGVGNSNLLQAYAKRELARANMKEKMVQAVMPGHYNDKGNPFLIDQVYHISYERGEIDEDMYLYQVEYTLTEEQGQRTILYFCPLHTLVADTTLQGNLPITGSL